MQNLGLCEPVPQATGGFPKALAIAFAQNLSAGHWDQLVDEEAQLLGGHSRGTPS